MAKIVQPLQAIFLIGAKPAAHRIVVQQQRSGNLGATPALVQKHERIRPPRHPMFCKPIPRQLD
jgi:hypothetical protein